MFSDQQVCIHGNGAIIDLAGGSVSVSNSQLSTTRLDVDHCVFINGGDALYYWQSANGNIVNCTFYKNSIAVKMFYCASESSAIKNCIFTENTTFAVLVKYYIYPAIAYNCSWNNGGDYYQDCGCPTNPYSLFVPVPGTGVINADPFFIDPAHNDFRLTTGSPCIGSGDPAGTDLGAIPYSAGMAPGMAGKKGPLFSRFSGPNPVMTAADWPLVHDQTFQLYSMDGKRVYPGSINTRFRSIPGGWYAGVWGTGKTSQVRPLVIIR